MENVTTLRPNSDETHQIVFKTCREALPKAPPKSGATLLAELRKRRIEALQGLERRKSIAAAGNVIGLSSVVRRPRHERPARLLAA